MIAALSAYGLIPTISISDPSLRIAFELDFRNVATPRNPTSLRKSVLLELMRVLAEETHQPTLEELFDVHREVERVAQYIKRRHSSLFGIDALKELAFVGSESTHRVIAKRGRGPFANWANHRRR